ncbi:MAG: adenylate/guanylate cyclase domain-containing protein [Deltaproteobacteria bacterium]|nr:adenylate/guanylate cyclase domain-containing protein [Candidatus Zymogenaceae bacterium]
MKNIKKLHPILFKSLIGVIIGLSVCLCVILLYLMGVFTSLESKTSDVRFRLFGDPRHDPRIVIITVDEASLNFYREYLGTWPWPREVFGALIGYLADGGARIVAFDMLFAEPDLDDPASDAALARAAASFSGVITSMVFFPSTQVNDDTYETLLKKKYLSEHFSVNVVNTGTITFGEYGSVTLAYLGLFGASSSAGCINFVADPDGPSRTSYPLYRYQDRYYPSLALISALRSLGVDPKKEEVVISRDNVLTVGPVRIPLLDDGRMVLNWHGPYQTYDYYPIGDIIESMAAIRRGQSPRIAPETFSDKIVLVGTTATSLYDLRATPFSPVYPGVELNATAIDNILNNDHVRTVGRAGTLLLILALSLIVALISARSGSASIGIVCSLAVLVLFTAAAVILFVSDRIMVEYVAPASALLLSFVVSVTLNYITEGRAKRKFREAFAKYVSPQVVDEISKNIDNLKLDSGDRRDITILFSDIRGFTSMSERLAPEEVVRRLNIYFKAMVEVVFQFDGTLDKYVGDAIMAFFGAPKDDPDHADKACRCALGMAEQLKEVNERLISEGIPPMKIGIGINTGEVVVGNIGSERRMDYTVIGDSVNLASRLEGMNKEFGTTIIISEFTRAKAPGFAVKDLGSVRVKGKEDTVRIYELTGEKGAGDEPDLR